MRMQTAERDLAGKDRGMMKSALRFIRNNWIACWFVFQALITTIGAIAFAAWRIWHALKGR